MGPRVIESLPPQLHVNLKITWSVWVHNRTTNTAFDFCFTRPVSPKLLLVYCVSRKWTLSQIVESYCWLQL